MIFDWEENSKQVLKNGHYSQNDRWERRNEYEQQKRLIAYLLSCGKTKEEIKKIWLGIPSTFLECAIDYEDINEYFEKIFAFGENIKSQWASSLKEFAIYQEEIDYINKTSHSYEFRKYLFMMLGLYKYYNLTYSQVSLPSRIRAFAFEMVCPGKSYRRYSTTLIQQNLRCGRPISGKGGAKAYTIITFAKKEGKIKFKAETPYDVLEHLDLIEEPTEICPICGKRFTVNLKTKRECCEECWRKKEKERIRKATKNWRIRCDGENRLDDLMEQEENKTKFSGNSQK